MPGWIFADIWGCSLCDIRESGWWTPTWFVLVSFCWFASTWGCSLLGSLCDIREFGCWMPTWLVLVSFCWFVCIWEWSLLGSLCDIRESDCWTRELYLVALNMANVHRPMHSSFHPLKLYKMVIMCVHEYVLSWEQYSTQSGKFDESANVDFGVDYQLQGWLKRFVQIVGA